MNKLHSTVNMIDINQTNLKALNEVNQYHSIIFNPYIDYNQLLSINKVTKSDPQYPKIQIHKRLLNILQNLLFIFTFLQCCIIIYLIYQYDIHLRLRSPLNDLPNYIATRIPWIPEQYQLKNQMSTIWWSLCIIYMPIMIIFCRYYLEVNENGFYLLDLKESPNGIKQTSSLKTHHLLDDGENSILIIDIIQNMFECCGIDKGFVDWVSDHVETPYLHTYQNLMRNVNDSYEANYSIEISTNRSVPFSCYKRIKYNLDIDNILLINGSNNSSISNNELFHNKGCVEPILHFVTSKWMKSQMLCLLIIILTMTPQIIVMLANIQVEALWKEIKTLMNKIMNITKKGVLKFIEIANAGISQLKKPLLLHIFNIKNYEEYFEKLLESDEKFYYEQLTRHEQIDFHESVMVHQEIKLIETTLEKSPSIFDQNSKVEQFQQQQSQQIEQSTRPGRKQSYYQLTNQQQQQRQKHRQYSVKYTSHRKSKIYTNLNRIPINKLHKSYVHIRSNTRLPKVNPHINERPTWKYTYKV
ncbi:unnamed protein product [Schistosoma rodhaini]|uniref:Uncharacterized protein n=1 Tax=Schistosoma rodhaini TaxID=6188 RepID=A0AA85ESU3_9TREM|nr:unnamed protein product [Schistosoma rodhaini]